MLLIVLAVVAANVALPGGTLRLAHFAVADEGLAARLRADIESLPAGRAPGTPGHAAARIWLRTRLAEVDIDLMEHEESWPGRSGGSLWNLEAVLPGSDASAPIVMVTAHYDTVPGTPGADDDGSGCVVLLEVARRLAREPVGAEVRLLWFDGEERGLLGALRYVQSLSGATRHRIVGVINLESVGYTNFAAGSQRLPSGVSKVFDPGDAGDFILLCRTSLHAPCTSVLLRPSGPPGPGPRAWRTSVGFRGTVGCYRTSVAPTTHPSGTQASRRCS